MGISHATTGATAVSGAGQRPRLDVNRVIGISGTIAANILLLMLLLVPLSQPEKFPLVEPAPPIVWIEAKPVKPEPPPQIPVEVVRPQTSTPARVRPQVPPRVVEPVIVDQGTVPTQPEIPAPVTRSTEPSAEPSSGARLRYLTAPAPRYPREMLLSGIEGTVLLEVLVGIDGRPVEARVHQSSGHRELDDAARRQVLRRWHFQPAMQDGRAIQAIGIVPIEFKIGR